MGKSVWMTPSEALEEMKRRLPHFEPSTLAFWGRDGTLRARAHSARIFDGTGYVALADAQTAKATWWEDVWAGIADPCTYPDGNRLNWTVGELNVLRGGDLDSFEEISVQGLELHRIDLIRCIRASKGDKERRPRANPDEICKFVDGEVSENGLYGLTERGLEQAVKARFPNALGARRQALKHLHDLRCESK